LTLPPPSSKIHANADGPDGSEGVEKAL